MRMLSQKWAGLLVILGGCVFFFGCAHARSGRRLDLPSEKDPRYKIFMAVSDWEQSRDEEEIPTKKLLQIYLYERAADKQRITYRKKIRNSAHIEWDAKLMDTDLTVQGNEIATKLVHHQGIGEIDQITTEPRKDKIRRTWTFVFKRQPNGKFLLVSKQGEFL